MTKASKRKPTKPRMKVVKAWGGFESGRLFIIEACDEYDRCGESHFTPQIFTREKDAKKRFRDVRRVLISIAPSKGKRK